MANELKMANVESILQLQALHWSARRIAQAPGHRPWHGAKAPQAVRIRSKTSHSAHRLGGVKTSH